MKKSLSETYRRMVDLPFLNETVNEHESIHNEIISKLHKHYPEMSIKKVKHVEKTTGRSGQGEYHKYEAEMPIHDSVKHLFSSIRSEVNIAHDREGNVHGTLGYRYDHPGGGSNGHTVASIGMHGGSWHIRHQATGVVKKA